MSSSIGSRIKRYEAVYDFGLTPRSPLVIRVDGRAFHTFLRHAERPFDSGVVSAMVESAKYVAEQMQGFKLAYVQSDECTFVLTDYDDLDTQGWFDYRLAKVVSISASLFTNAFNHHYRKPPPPAKPGVIEIRRRPEFADMAGPLQRKPKDLAAFDSRAFTAPIDDVPNVIVWRQRDWERNSVQMLTRAHFSHKECNGKKVPDMHEMLHGIGVNWAHLPDQLKNGTLITREMEEIHSKLSYQEIADLISAEKG